MPPHSLTLSVVGAGHAVGRLVRLQRRQRPGRQRARPAWRWWPPRSRPPPRPWSGSSSSGSATAAPACWASSPARWPAWPPSPRPRATSAPGGAHGHRRGGRPWSASSAPPRSSARLGYDDSLDAFGVHGVGGIVGSVLTGAFAAQPWAAARPWRSRASSASSCWPAPSTAAWSAALTWVCLKVADLALGARVDEEQEVLGLDLTDARGARLRLLTPCSPTRLRR